MSTYDYTCPTCTRTEERRVKYAERNAQTCGTCGATLARVEISGTAALLSTYAPGLKVGAAAVPGHFGRSAAKRGRFL